MIALASDHAGFQYKEKIKKLLDSLKESYKDFGTSSPEPTDYPDFAHAAAQSIARGECDRGIMVCGSGIGMDIVANKSKGVRAAVCTTVEMARHSRSHNDANALVIGERLTDWPTVEQIVKVWLETGFEGGRHERRVKKIHSLTQL
ncbi:MAG: ribose 5-phosphate isomerase B [Bacteroidota bacterium]